ncbi:hypothetical protein [Chroococcidiopsis sp. CCMEE 29]|uniref:hypothetical protein n=1 Tax=Chroococcidiopsis sp. CCMEE 29 TaxID=155894 RepID=UPI00201FB8F5|nr:hypothetical protein [Chroococcidiopsis sp. CCMEE 29]
MARENECLILIAVTILDASSKDDRVIVPSEGRSDDLGRVIWQAWQTKRICSGIVFGM